MLPFVTYHGSPGYLEYFFSAKFVQFSDIHIGICYALLLYLGENFFQQSAVLGHTFWLMASPLQYLNFSEFRREIDSFAVYYQKICIYNLI